MLKPGYSLAEDLEPLTRTMSVFKCASAAACEGEVGLANVTEGSDCAAGFGGVICASCLLGYYNKKGICTECSVSDKGLAILTWAGVAFAALIGCLLLALKLSGVDTSAMKDAHTVFNARRSKLKIMLGMCQVLQLVGGTFNITIPSPFKDVTYFLSYLTLDIVALVNLQCLANYDWRTKFVLQFVVFIFIIGCVYAIGRYVASRDSDSKQLRATFDGFDLDGSGMLEANELKSLIADLHLEMDVDEITRAMGSQNDDGEISFEVFSVWWRE